MNARYGLTINDLLDVLSDWDSKVRMPIFLSACGGIALDLLGYLIDELERQKLDSTDLREISDSWIP